MVHNIGMTLGLTKYTDFIVTTLLILWWGHTILEAGNLSHED